MFKLVSSKNLTNFSRHKVITKIPVVEKPLISHMSYLDLRPEYNEITNFKNGLTSIFKAAVKTSLGIDVSETINKSKEIVNSSKVETKFETKVIEETKKEQKVHEYIPRYEYSYVKHREPVVKKIFSLIGNVLTYPIEKVQELINTLDFKIWNIKQDIIEKKEEIKPQKHYQQMEEINKLSLLQQNFYVKLDQYKNMFEPKDIIPDTSEFNNYNTLSYNSLQKLTENLDKRIDHQTLILSLKNRYRKGAKHYTEGNDNNNLKKCNLHEIYPNNRFKYKKELKRLCKLYIENSKIIEEPITSFRNVTKRFFQKSKENLEEIFEIKKHPILSISEKIPYLGIIPKSVRVADQINLTGCILDDFEDITKTYIQNGIQPTMLKYNKQYDIIERFTQNRKLSKNDEKYTEKMLALIKKAKISRFQAYTQILDNFTKGGLAIKNTCNNIRLKDGISMALKTAKLLAALG